MKIKEKVEMTKWENMKNIAQEDINTLKKAEDSYGDSWKRRGGIGAFMMLARKFDRIENQTSQHNWDIFEAGDVYAGDEGLLDDIRDLRRYLILVENELVYGEDHPPRLMEVEPEDEDEDEEGEF